MSENSRLCATCRHKEVEYCQPPCDNCFGIGCKPHWTPRQLATPTPTYRIRTTPICVSVHAPGENPIFGDSVTHVQIEDEAAGGYIILRQFPDDPKPAEIGMDLDELRAVLAAAEQLLAGYDAAIGAGAETEQQ